jgi:predicted amidohydrolase
MANLGAEIFILPAAFAHTTGQIHWEILLRARAIENFCYMLAPGQGGNHRCGRQTFGHSMIIAPWGNILAQADGVQTSVVLADIDLQEVAIARQKVPVLLHQKLYSTR